ncbi:MAG: hypothetical protein MJY62_00910 [Bacteroidales bacterium]|nr:hypothetical protein [Bacteroidales bacterium]
MTERKDIWYFIVNPRAGSGKTISQWQKAERRLRQLKVVYRFAKTMDVGHAETLTLDAAADGFRRFMAVGGDGTVHEVLCGIMKYVDSHSGEGVKVSDFTLGVVPIGSGNDWIKSTGVPRDTEEVIELIKKKSFGKQDVVRATFLRPANYEPLPDKVTYMLNIGGVGFDSRVCERVNDQKALGQTHKMIYFKALLNVIGNFYSFPVRILANDAQIFEGECYSIAYGIGKYSGGGMRQVPSAILDDGLLNMTIIPKMPIISLLCKLPKLFNGKLEGTRPLMFIKSRSITILPASEQMESIEFDGEVPGHIPVRLDVVEDQLNILVGDDSGIIEEIKSRIRKH